jgi:predicted phage terminase large subunit-like protein
MAIIELTDEGIKGMARDRFARINICKDSFFHFLMNYLQEDFELDPADFHKEMIDALDSVDDLDKYLAILGFRGSAKSTILEAFALWSLINGKHNLIVYIRSTIDDAKMTLANIRNRIEESPQLQKDFNITLDDTKAHNFREKWSESQITIGNCTMIARSRGQKIRGMKFKKARIDLIIGDDLEDVKDADSKEKREATRKWFFAEVLPATKQGVLSDNVKVVLLGNLVHRDCLIKHLSKSKTVKVLEFWIYDENGKITWEGLYPNEEAVQKEKEKVMMAGEGLGLVIWAREYLGKEVDSEDMVLKMEDIQYYPDEWLQRTPSQAGVGIDFAISKKETADYTAMVKGVDVKNDDGERKLLVMKGNVEQRLGFEETIKKAVEINEIMPHGTKFYPEKVGYQEAAHEIMKKNGLTVVPMSAVGDKKARIASACFYVKSGRVLFPREGAENVINNLTGFGIEEHDDLADAFAYMVLGMVKKGGGILFG